MMPEVLYQFEKLFYLLCWLERRTLLTWLLMVSLFMIKNAYKVAFFKKIISYSRGFIKNWRNRRLLASNRMVTMAGQSSVRKQENFSWRILCSSRRILRSPMPNEHPAIVGLRTENRIWVFTWYTLFFGFQYPPVLAYTYKAIVLFQQPSCNLLPVFCCCSFTLLLTRSDLPSMTDCLNTGRHCFLL